MDVKFYDCVDERLLKFAVIVAKSSIKMDLSTNTTVTFKRGY